MMLDKKHLFWFVTFFILYEVNTYISNDMIMPAMVQVVNAFHASVSDISKSVSWFVIGGSIIAIFLVPACDIFSKKWVLLFGNMFFLISNILSLFSHNIDQFLITRFMQGAGMSFIFIGYTVLHESTDDKTFVKLGSILGNITILAPLLGPIVGSFVIINHSWHYIFLINIVLAVCSLVGLYLFMPYDRPAPGSKLHIKSHCLNCYKILTNSNFLLGCANTILYCTIMVGWIALAPVLIMHTLHKSFEDFVIYQAFVFSGAILSGFVIRYCAGKISFANIVRIAAIIEVIGCSLALIFANTIVFVLVAMFIAVFACFFVYGVLIRSIITDNGFPINTNSAVQSTFNGISFAVSLEVANKFCAHFNYSFTAFTGFNLGVSLVLLGASLIYAKRLSGRDWK